MLFNDNNSTLYDRWENIIYIYYMHYYLLPLVFGGLNKEQKITDIDLKIVYWTNLTHFLANMPDNISSISIITCTLHALPRSFWRLDIDKSPTSVKCCGKPNIASISVINKPVYCPS